MKGKVEIKPFKKPSIKTILHFSYEFNISNRNPLHGILDAKSHNFNISLY